MENGNEKPLSYRKIADRFSSAKEALDAHAAEKVLIKGEWHVARWLYMPDIENESRLDYLKRCRKESILKAEGYKELKKLEKQAKKQQGE